MWSYLTNNPNSEISAMYCEISLESGNLSVNAGIYTTIGGLSSKLEEFLAARSQFNSDHGVDFSTPSCCKSATFVRPLFAIYCPSFFTGKNNNAALHFMPRMNAVFALDVATALRQINR